jgi:hypothetical protein
MIMKLFKNLLPALALLLGATLAMAMNFPGNPTERYAKHPTLEIWYDLTDIEPGDETYDCDEFETTTCSRVAPNSSAMQVEPGQFIVNGNLPEVTQ